MQAVISKVINCMQQRKNISSLEMSKIAAVLDDIDFSIEEIPKEEQERLGLILVYLMKYTSGIDERGNPVDRFGA